MALAALLFTLFPGIDLTVSGWFFTPGIPLGFTLAHTAGFMHLKRAVPWVITLTVLATVLLAARRAAGRGRGPSLRAALFVLLSIAVAPGLVANVMLKDNWGRARPNQLALFNGSAGARFTTPLVPTDQCDSNCSFVAGDGAAGFSLLAPALVAPAPVRPLAIAGAVAVGVLFGANRIAMGGHFLSDVVFSGLITWGVIWLLYRLIMVPGGWDRMRAWIAEAAAWATAPRHRLGRRLTGAAAMLLALVALVDEPVARWAHGFDPGVTRLFGRISQLGLGTGWLIGFALVGAACWLIGRIMDGVPGAARPWRSLMLAAWFGLAATAAAGLANDTLKLLVGRTRPKLFFEHGPTGLMPGNLGAEFQSFPSGHSAMAFAVATVLWTLWPRHVAAYYLVALLVAAARVLGGAHWPSDAVAGAALGVAVALGVRRFWCACGADPAEAVAGRAVWIGLPARVMAALAAARSCVGPGRWLGFRSYDSSRVRNGRLPAE